MRFEPNIQARYHYSITPLTSHLQNIPTIWQCCNPLGAHYWRGIKVFQCGLIKIQIRCNQLFNKSRILFFICKIVLTRETAGSAPVLINYFLSQTTAETELISQNIFNVLKYFQFSQSEISPGKSGPIRP